LIMNHLIDYPSGSYSIVSEFVALVATLGYVIDKSTEILGKPSGALIWLRLMLRVMR